MDLLRLGSNSLNNVQQALATTGHNITNANTDGYSRQTVNFEARQSQNFGYGYLGAGAFVSGVERSTDAFLTSQVQNFSASESRYSTYLEFSNRLDSLLADSDNNLSSSLQKFFSGVQEVASNPSSLPERQVMLSEANSLAQRMQTLDRNLRNLGVEINEQLKTTVAEVNGLSESIRQLNLQIVSASVSGASAAPNDLLDRRDLLITELSKKVGISVVPLHDGSVNIFAGKGQGLVVGNQVSKLETRVNPYDNTRLEVAFTNTAGGNIISQYIDGGELHGLLDFRDRNMAQAESRAGLLALVLSGEFNTQHLKGYDLQANQGGLFFSQPVPDMTAHSANLGTSAPTLTLDDMAAIRASEYRLKYDGTVWHMTRMSDNTAVSGTGVLTLDGMSVDTSAGVPVAGDSFSFNPARDAAHNFNVLIRDPQKIAAAAAVKTVTPATNAGTGKLDNLTVTDANLLPLPAALTVSFDPDALGVGVPGFVLSGAFTGTLAYDPATEAAGKDFTLAGLGISFHVSGTPVNGDSFTIGDNSGARGDNKNALAMASLQTAKVVSGRTDTLQSFYTALVADVGVNHRQAESNLSVENALLEQARSYRDSVSGVNLDEEAANMLRFQQAYQASAQVIKIADEVFRTLLQALG